MLTYTPLSLTVVVLVNSVNVMIGAMNICGFGEYNP